MINVGDMVKIRWSDPNRPDEDVVEWLETQPEDIFMVDETSGSSRHAWIKNCPYAISMEDLVRA